MPGITTTRLPYTSYYPAVRKTRYSELKINWETYTYKLHDIKPFFKECEHSITTKGNVKLKLTVKHLMFRNDQQ